MRAHVVFDEELVETAEALLHSEGLRDDVHAVLLVLDHLFDSAQLALQDPRAVEGTFLDVIDHIEIVPPGGLECRLCSMSLSPGAE